MKVTFISCYLTHHQIPFSEKMYSILGDNYKFISTMEMEEERKKLGWNSKEVPYEIKIYESHEMKIRADEVIENSDVVILGSASDKLIEKRLKRGKLTFKYSERLYKKGITIKNILRASVSAWLHHGRFQKYPLYMLCASAYTTVDLNVFKNYKNRTYKWGYFPEFKKYNMEDLKKAKSNDITEILWVGRLIDCKHAEDAVEVAHRLNKSGHKFSMKIIGNGYMENQIKELISKYSLSQQVNFLGGMSSDNVRDYMERANIYLFTSDFQEGWGAVLNEAMNSGCAVIASHAIGAVPFLIKNYENGLIYKYGDNEDLYQKMLLLLGDKLMQNKLGANAYRTIENIWNEHIAAERFLTLSRALLKGESIEFFEGPCSKAEIIKNDWM